MLAIIPGTSRSGATIVGGLLLGLSRACVAEFTFYLAIPVMAGASLLKVLKFAVSGVAITAPRWLCWRWAAWWLSWSAWRLSAS